MAQYRYLYFVAAVSFLVSIYLISFSIYNFPSADDFVYGAKYSLNSFSLAINSYLYGSSGRVFSNTLYYFFAGISNNHLIIYQILPILTFIMFVIVSYMLFFIILQSFSKKIVFSLTCIFILVWLLSLNSMNDTVLWYGGIFNYFLPMTLMFLSIYLFLKAYYSKSISYIIFMLFLSSVILFISSFSNEALFLVFLIIYFLIFFYSIIYKNNRIIYMLILNILVLIIAFIFILFAPGSANRVGGGNTNLLFGIYRGLMTALERGFSYYFTTAVIPLSIFLYLIFYKIEPKRFFPNLSYKYHGVIFLVLGIILSWAAHFVVSYGLGALGLPPRAKVIPQTFSIITFTVSNIYFLYYFNFYKKFYNNKRKFIIFISLYALFSISNSDDFTGSIISLGEHKGYYEQSKTRLDFLKIAEKNKDEIILKKIDVAPYPIAPIDERMIRSDCNYYVNTQLAYYFNYKGCIRLENGIDGEDSSSKKFFRTKDYILKDGARIWLYSLFKYFYLHF